MFRYVQVFSREGGTWSEVGVRNAKGEGMGDRQEARTPERGPWRLSGGGVRTSLHSGNGNGRRLCDGLDKTREQ